MGPDGERGSGTEKLITILYIEFEFVYIWEDYKVSIIPFQLRSKPSNERSVTKSNCNKSMAL